MGNVNMNRRSALKGSIAAIAGGALVSTAAKAATSDPHVAWLGELSEIRRKTDERWGKLTAAEERLSLDLGREQASICVKTPNGTKRFFSAAEIEKRRLNEMCLLTDALGPQMSDLGGLDVNATKEAASMFWDDVLTEFREEQARYEAHPAYQETQRINAELDSLQDRELKMMYHIADTPATTLEGLWVQMAILTQWITENNGAPNRPGSAFANGIDRSIAADRELDTLTETVLATLAALAGRDPRLRYGPSSLADIQSGKVIEI